MSEAVPRLDEFQQLLGRLSDGQLDAAEAERLCGMLRGSPETREYYIDYMSLNALLHVRHAMPLKPSLQEESQTLDPLSCSCTIAPEEKNQDESQISLALPAPLRAGEQDVHPLVDPSETSRSFGTFSSKSLGWLLFGLLSVVIAAVWHYVPSTGNDQEPKAILSQTAEPPAALSPADPKTGGVSSISLTSGTANLRLPGIGHVIVEGPAQFDMLSPTRARLNTGRIKMRVTEKSGRGFVVETPYGEITDLGTEFGVDLTEQNKAGLVVFEGAVDLRVAEAEAVTRARVERLVGGEGVVINRSGQLDRINSIITGRAATFLRGTDRPLDDSWATIADVTDNLNTNQTKKFYEIVVEGLKEDTLAYVDRPEHEWNGLTEEGIPEYLIGADYVKTFNGDKMQSGLKINVMLNRPARLFVFFDDRVAPPQWLKKSFRDTGDKIGLDIGAYRGYRGIWDDKMKRGQGPGDRVDFACSIWEQVVSRPGKITLGSNSGRTSQMNMYGIAAIPYMPLAANRKLTKPLSSPRRSSPGETAK